MGWTKPPPVMAIHGTEGFLCRREVTKAIQASRSTGRVVERVFGEDREQVADLLGGGMFGEATLVLVSDPGKLDPELVADHLKEGDGTVCLVLLHEGKIKKGSKLDKVFAEVPKKNRLTFDRPPQQYKLQDYAVKFVVLEAKRFGLTISGDLAEALVGKVGTDLGVLHYEMMKVEAYLAATEGGTEVTAPAMRATMVRTGEANIGPLVDAVGRADARRVLRETGDLKANFAGDDSSRTLTVCAWLGSAAVKWLHAASLHDSGASVEEGAQRLKMAVYPYKAFTLPVAKRWGKARLIALVKRISRVENGVRSGHVDPWTELEAVLTASCRAASRRG